MARPAASRRPFVLSATVDFPDDVNNGVYTPELVDVMLGRLKRMGVTRVYWNYYGDTDPDSYWAGRIFDRVSYGRETLRRIGEPVKAATLIAHKRGIELFAVIKPFDLGGPAITPEGSPEFDPSKPIHIGGNVVPGYTLIEKHPQLRAKRRPYDSPPNLQTTPIRRIRLLKSDASPTRVRNENLEIWTSPRNYRYEIRKVTFELKESVEPARQEVRDEFGTLVTAAGSPVRTLSLEGLNLTDKYIIVTTNFHDGAPDFANTAVVMVEAYGDGPDPFPIEVATRRAFKDDGCDNRF